jgi:hypothetical protein
LDFIAQKYAFSPCPIQILCIFALPQKLKGKVANILKERRCTNALSAACRISQIPTSPYDKAMANAHVWYIHPFVYMKKRGLRHCLSSVRGDARALQAG